MKSLQLVLLSFVLAHGLRAEPGGIAQLGDKPYDFAVPGADGSTATLSSLQGRVVMLYFFSINEGSGAGTMMLKMIQKYTWPGFSKSGLLIIGVVRGAEPSEVKLFASQNKVPFPLVADPKREIYHHYAEKNLPRTYVIGKNGLIDLVSLGYTDDELHDRIENAIAKELGVKPLRL